MMGAPRNPLPPSIKPPGKPDLSTGLLAIGIGLVIGVLLVVSGVTL